MIIIVLLCSLLCAVKGSGVDVCNNDACKEIDVIIRNNMDSTKDPCSNFYEYTCKNTKDDFSLLRLLDKTRISQMKKLFKEEPSYDKEFHKYLKIYYSTCINTRRTDELGISVITELLKNVGGWPILGDWNQDNWSIEKTEINLIKTGFKAGSIFKIRLVEDRETPNKLILKVGPADLWMSIYELSMEDSALFKEYNLLMIDIAKKFNVPDRVANVEQTKTLKFEQSISKLITVKDGRLETEIKRLTLRDLDSQVGWIKFSNFLRSIAPTDVSLSDNDVIEVTDLEYLKKVGDIVETHKSEVANVMIWHALYDLMINYALPSSITERFNKMHHNLGKENLKTDLDEQCTFETYRRLPLAYSYFYSKTFLTDKMKNTVVDILDKIIQEMKNNVNNIDWMDDTTRQKTNKRLQTLKTSIGLDIEVKDVNKYTSLYSNLQLKEDDIYAKTLLAVNKWKTELDFRRLKLSIKETEWWDSMTHWSRIGYKAKENKLDIPVEYLQPPVFHVDYPKYVNYARIGQIMGLMLVKAITSEESNSEDTGDNAWTQDTTNKYNDKLRCLKDEEALKSLSDGKYKEMSKQILSNQGALKLAYKSYERLGITEPSLPSFKDYSNKKIFWMAGASMYCNKDDDDKDTSALSVNGPCSMIPEFSNAFDCGTKKPLQINKSCALFSNK